MSIRYLLMRLTLSGRGWPSWARVQGAMRLTTLNASLWQTIYLLHTALSFRPIKSVRTQIFSENIFQIFRRTLSTSLTRILNSNGLLHVLTLQSPFGCVVCLSELLIIMSQSVIDHHLLHPCTWPCTYKIRHIKKCILFTTEPCFPDDFKQILVIFTSHRAK